MMLLVPTITAFFRRLLHLPTGLPGLTKTPVQALPAMPNVHAQQGFTLVELLIGSAVAVIGLYASLTLVTQTLRGNTDRRDSQAAGQLAEHTLATIQSEATMWIADIPPGYTTYLAKLPTPSTPGTTSGWQLAPGNALNADKRVGPLGADSRYDQGTLLEFPPTRGTRYCLHWRLTWVSAELVRAEVQVSWPKAHANPDTYKTCPLGMAADLSNLYSVTLPALVMKNVYVQ